MSKFEVELRFFRRRSICHQAAKVRGRKNRGQGPVPWKHMGRPTPRNDGQLIDRAIWKYINEPEPAVTLAQSGP